MLSIRTIARPVAFALALIVSAAPAAALAGTKDSGAAVKKDQKFPMKADSWGKRIEGRLQKSREHLARALEKRNVPEATRAQAKKDFDEGAAAVRAASTRAQADGTVTKAEAKEVRKVAKEMQQKMREKYGLSKGHGKGGNKGGNKSKEKRAA